MNDDIKALREEIAQLRERVAVLEHDAAPFKRIGQPMTPQAPEPWRTDRESPWQPPYVVTC